MASKEIMRFWRSLPHFQGHRRMLNALEGSDFYRPKIDYFSISKLRIMIGLGVNALVGDSSPGNSSSGIQEVWFLHKTKC